MDDEKLLWARREAERIFRPKEGPVLPEVETGADTVRAKIERQRAARIAAASHLESTLAEAATNRKAAKEDALRRVRAAIDDLKALGFDYRLIRDTPGSTV